MMRENVSAAAIPEASHVGRLQGFAQFPGLVQMASPTRRALLMLGLGLLVGGCESLAVTMAGVGTGTGVNHALGGMVYKTFTEPLPKVNEGALAALKRMAIKVDKVSKDGGVQTIVASSNERTIEIELEPISPRTTRMRAVARKPSGLWDSATATEIILQTEKRLSMS